MLKQGFTSLSLYRIDLIAAHAPISAHPAYFEVINHRRINHLPDLFIKFTYLIQYDWELAWNRPKLSIFVSIFATNSKTNKRPPKMIYLSALGAYWNEYGSWICHHQDFQKKMDCPYYLVWKPTKKDIRFFLIWTVGRYGNSILGQKTY